MSNTLYFTRGKKTEAALAQLIQNYGLEKTYESRQETIFRGERMMASLAKEYLFLYIYDEHDIPLRNQIRRDMYHSG